MLVILLVVLFMDCLMNCRFLLRHCLSSSLASLVHLLHRCKALLIFLLLAYSNIIMMLKSF